MKIRPLHDRVMVHRLDEGEQQVGGIIIPDTAKEKPQQGTIIAAGTGKANGNGKRVPLDVKAGDRILFGKYAGQEIQIDGQEYFIMKEDECWPSSTVSEADGICHDSDLHVPRRRSNP